MCSMVLGLGASTAWDILIERDGKRVLNIYSSIFFLIFTECMLLNS